MISSERIASGTKLIRFEGGPPEWDGKETAVIKTGTHAERWDHTADLAVVYEATGEPCEIEVQHERRNGTVVETKTGEVYRYLGYKEEMEQWVSQ